MIPPGTAVRDAHACYEVVVPVTVPDKPRFGSLLLIITTAPHCHTHQRENERNSAMWNCWRLRCMKIERLFQHPWRGNFNPQFTCTETSTQKIDEYDGRKSQ
jgi:hypothetical protein